MPLGQVYYCTAGWPNLSWYVTAIWDLC